jgi:hypothetical protein
MCPSQEKRTPFVGPRAIQKGELLFGRDKEASDLVDLLFSERIVLLHSPSGAGKSSLVNAGLIPALETEYLQILPVIRLNNELPEGFPKQDELAKANRYVLSTMLSLEPVLPDSGQSTPADLTTISLDQYLGGIDPDEALVLIFDQFEEVLTLDSLDLDAKHEFFRQLGEALRNPKRQRWALFATREDYVGSLDPYVQPIPTQLSVRMRLDLLGKEAAQQAIQRPRPAGADEEMSLLTDNFTPEAAKKLAEDLAQICVQQPDDSRLLKDGLHVEPVHLQVVCERLWREAQERGESQVGFDALMEVSTVDEALAGYFAEKVKAIADQRGVPERRIRRWFDQHLITAQGIRGQVMRDVGESKGLDNKVIEDLINAYLVRQERRRGVIWFELAHDRLIEPVRKDNAAWQKDELTPQQRTASVWDQQGQPESFFLRGKDLAEFEKWAAKHDQELEEFERKLLNVSQDHRKGETRLQILAIGLIGMLIVAVVAAFFSGIQWNSAKQQHATAQAALNTADAALNKVATSDSNAWATGLAAATSQNKAAAAQATSDQLRQTLVAVGTPMTMTLEQRQTVEVLQAEATAAQATADQLRSTADVASTAAAAAQQTAEAERDTAVQVAIKEQPTPTETSTATTTPDAKLTTVADHTATAQAGKTAAAIQTATAADLLSNGPMQIAGATSMETLTNKMVELFKNATGYKPPMKPEYIRTDPGFERFCVKNSETDVVMATGQGEYLEGRWGNQCSAGERPLVGFQVAIRPISPENHWDQEEPLFLYTTPSILRSKPQVAAFIQYYLENATQVINENNLDYGPVDEDIRTEALQRLEALVQP